MLSRPGHFRPNCISLCRSSLHFRNVQTMANYKQKLKFWKPTTGIFLHALVRVCRCSFDNTGKCVGLFVTVSRYSTFLLLGVSSPWHSLAVSLTWHFQLLLHNVSYTRRIQRKALLAFLLKHSIARNFNYLTFQRSRLGDWPAETLYSLAIAGRWTGGYWACSWAGTDKHDQWISSSD